MFQVVNLFNASNLRGLFGSGGRISNALSASFRKILAARDGRQVELAVKFIF